MKSVTFFMQPPQAQVNKCKPHFTEGCLTRSWIMNPTNTTTTIHKQCMFPVWWSKQCHHCFQLTTGNTPRRLSIMNEGKRRRSIMSA